MAGWGGIAPFALERHFARHEFSAPWLLSSSDCDGWPLQTVLQWADAETRALWDDLHLGYSDSRGIPQLRRQIASQYEGFTADQVLTMVPQEAILVAMQALLCPGDHVVCTFPGYQSLYEIARAIGCEVSLWEPREEEGWRFDPERLASLLRANTRLVVINFPHNPTGYLPPPADLARIVELVRGRNAWLFSDEMYRMLEHDARDRLPAACGQYDKAITLSGMSKAYGLAGTRVGWLVARDAGLVERMAELRDYTTICGAGPSEVLALIGLRARERIVSAHLERIARNLGVLDAFFVRRADRFSWCRPRAGTVGFARVKSNDAEALCERAVSEAGIMLLPSTVYGYGNSHVRLGFGRTNLPEALQRFDAFLDAA